jgi:hypothetical protein
MNANDRNANMQTESSDSQALDGIYSVAFRERALCGGGAWSREARIVVALAAQAGIVLDEETVIVCDVRDLQALQSVLRREVEKPRLPKAAARATVLDGRDRLLGGKHTH